MMRFLYFIFFIIMISNAVAADYYKFNYTVKNKESYTDILKKFIKPTSLITKDSTSILKMAAENPHVKDWRALEAGTIITLFFDHEDFDFELFENYVIASKDSFNPSIKEITAYDYRTSVYYVFSFGNFSQENEKIATINFDQSIPITIGGQAAYVFSNPQYALTGSFLFKKNKASTSNVDNVKLDVPTEYGLGLYLNYNFKETGMVIYSGVFHENLHTFNMEALKEIRELTLDETKLNYFTIGLKNRFKVSSLDFRSRVSASKSISATGTTKSIYVAESDYNAFKLNFDLDFEVSTKFYLKSQIELLNVTGSSNISALAFGLGVGYVLF